MLVFVNHCQGATVAFQLETLLEKDLKALGYSEKNVDYLMRQVHSVNVAPVTPYGVSKTTNYKFVSFDDEVATSVHTEKMLYLLERKAEHRRFLQNLAQNNTAANTTEKLRPFTMNMCAFHPSPTETVFAVNNLYPLEINQDKRYAGIEHTFDSYADVEDDMRTKPGDQLSMMLNGTANWLVENALKNRHQLKELPRMEDDKTFSLMLPRAETNRFNLMDREMAIFRQRQQNGK
jgi:hypothetical protein